MVIQPWNGKQIFQKILVLLDTYLFLEIVGNMDKGNALPIKTKIVVLFIGIKCLAHPSKFPHFYSILKFKNSMFFRGN